MSTALGRTDEQMERLRRMPPEQAAAVARGILAMLRYYPELRRTYPVADLAFIEAAAERGPMRFEANGDRRFGIKCPRCGGVNTIGARTMDKASDGRWRHANAQCGDCNNGFSVNDAGVASSLDDTVSLREAIQAAADETDTDASIEQKKAGNYRKGQLTIQGLRIAIESPKGSTRSGIGEDGKPWSVKMKDHYGYIRKTESEADGDHVDVFIGPDPESEIVFVIDQTKPDGRFDEHKCMLGWTNASDAKDAYHANYSPGWKGFAGIKAMPIEAFREWLQSGDTGTPAREQVVRYEKHKFATTQLDLADGKVSGERSPLPVLREMQEEIPDHDLTEDGKPDLHITVLYGL